MFVEYSEKKKFECRRFGEWIKEFELLKTALRQMFGEDWEGSRNMVKQGFKEVWKLRNIKKVADI